MKNDTSILFGGTGKITPKNIEPLVQPNSPIPSTELRDTQQSKWRDPKVIVPLGYKIADKIKAVSNDLKERLVEREDVIDDLLLALVTGNHAVLLGDPGVAKSQLSIELCNRIVGGKYFEWLLNKFTDPAELVGPFSIKAMENDRFMRVTTGKVPECHIFFCDEVFRANEPTLNILLAMTNERVFHNDGKVIPVPLISLIGASNEEPDDSSLSAFYDRLLFRFIVNPVADALNRGKMYSGYLSRRNPSIVHNIVNTVTVDEMMDIRMAARHVTIPKDILNQYDLLLHDIKINHQVSVSDRRKNEGLGVLQGAAILAKRDVVLVDDFRHLIHIWWQRRDDIRLIKDMIIKISNPYEAKLDAYKTEVQEFLNNINSADPTNVPKLALEAKTHFGIIVKDLDGMARQARSCGRDISRIEDLKRHIMQKQGDVLNRYLGVTDDLLKVVNMQNIVPIGGGDTIFPDSDGLLI